MSAPRRYRSAADLPSVIPVFPLNGVVMLPRARLPLNIFEPRYLAMIDTAMSGLRVIGMIQPRLGDEDLSVPALAEVGCLGRIVEYSETDDGRYLITLAGITRFKVATERDKGTPYRQVVADYAGFGDDFVEDDAPDLPRERLIAALMPYLQSRDMRTDWATIEGAPAEALVNALSMLCPFSPPEKQALLEAQTLKERGEALILLLEMANAGPAPGVPGSDQIN